MNKIDLIIDALQELMYSNSSTIAAKKYRAALAAARELQALKPAAYVGGLNEFDAMRLKSEGFHMYTPLFALDEDTK